MNGKPSDPAKPGSKLAQVQALGRRGGIRPVSLKPPAAEAGGTKARKQDREDAAQARSASAPAKRSVMPINRPRKARQTLTAKLRTAKAALAEAEEDEMNKPGPTPVIGEPWKDMNPPIAKSTYYRRLRKEEANAAAQKKAAAKRATHKAGKKT